MSSTHEPSLAIGSEGQACTNIIRLKIGKVGKDLFRRHAGGKIVQHIVNGYAQPSNARLSASLARFDRYSLCIVHTNIV